MSSSSTPAAQITAHRRSSTLDPDTLITTAITSLTIDCGSPETADGCWGKLIAGADPVNWSVSVPDVFRLSERVGPYTPRPLGQSQLGWKGQLHEIVEWGWNRGTVARFENILDIDFAGTDATVRLDYALARCLSSDLWMAHRTGGLDVDEGHYQLQRSGPSIAVEAVKRLRHAEPQTGLGGFASLLNHLAPTALGLWLDRIVQRGVHEVIQATAGQAAAPVPSTYAEGLMELARAYNRMWLASASSMLGRPLGDWVGAFFGGESPRRGP